MYDKKNQEINQIKGFYKILDKLLKAIKSLAEYYPVKSDDFLDLIVPLYRKNTFTCMAILHLAKYPELGDSNMALARKIIEDIVSYEWIKLNGKDKWAKILKDYYYVQFHQQYNFLLQLDVDPEIFTGDSKKILSEYDRVKDQFVFNKDTGEEQRSWSGRTKIEDMIEDLHKAKVFDDQINKLISQGYVYGSWKTHFNPYDLQTYISDSIHTVEFLEYTKKALGLAAILHLYLSSHYIEEIRMLNGSNLFKEVESQLNFILDEINHQT